VFCHGAGEAITRIRNFAARCGIFPHASSHLRKLTAGVAEAA
jgi:hypothetical protein